MYAGLVKKDQTWYDVTTTLPAHWADWSSDGSDGSYSDCAKLDIKTGEYNWGYISIFYNDKFLFAPAATLSFLDLSLTPAGLLLKDNCKYELCPVCVFADFPVDLQLRGVCLDSPVEKFYVLHNSTELHGHGGSVLSWVSNENTWRITKNYESLATLQSDERSLPLGINLWHFHSSDCSDPG